MPVGIDVNRGVEIRRERSTGVRVYMYQSEPGVYLNAFGKPISEAFAAKAGFPTAVYARKRIAREKIADFTQKMRDEMDVEDLTEGKTKLAEANGYIVFEMPFGNAIVVSDEGEQLTPTPIAAPQALELLAALSGDETETPVPEPKPLEKAKAKS
jgi:hypothetical protein